MSPVPSAMGCFDVRVPYRDVEVSVREFLQWLRHGSERASAPGTCVPWHGELAAGARGELGHRAEWACPRPLEWACIPAHVRGRLNDFTWESSSPRSRRPRMGGISTSHDWTDQDFMAVPGSAECRGSRQAQHWKVHFEGEKCRCTIIWCRCALACVLSCSSSLLSSVYFVVQGGTLNLALRLLLSCVEWPTSEATTLFRASGAGW